MPATAAADIEYDQILVPIVDSRIANEMMVLACQVAREKKSAVDALYVIEVPLNLPLDARLVRERAKGQAVLERAQAIADQFGVKANPILINARQAGRAIVDVARERQLRGHRPRLAAQAAGGPAPLRQHGRLRAGARAHGGAPQPRAGRLPDVRRAAAAAGRGRPGVRHGAERRHLVGGGLGGAAGRPAWRRAGADAGGDERPARRPGSASLRAS